MESSKDSGCQAPEGPILCISNCGFFGSATTMNMCSKCHKEMILKQEQAKFAASSIESIVNGGSSNEKATPVVIKDVEMITNQVEIKVVPEQAQAQTQAVPEKSTGPNRCMTCKKRVGLTAFQCRCGNLFCGVHRYSDKHDCQFDYRSSGQESIAKANPVVKADKLDKI